MARKIVKWEAADGTLYASEKQAQLHDAKLQFSRWYNLADDPSQQDPDKALRVLGYWATADVLTEWLKKHHGAVLQFYSNIGLVQT